LREDIDTQPHQFKSILMEDNLRQTFFPGVKKDEKKIVAAFCKMSAENALKTKPKVNLSELFPEITLLIGVGLRCRSQGRRFAEAPKLRTAEGYFG
jgi:hypothetical protein